MRVLVLAYDFPPYVSVGGLRPWSWYRYLGEFGVEPVVVTRQWENRYGDERDYVAPSATRRVEVERSSWGTVVRTPYRPNLANRILLTHGPDRFALLRRAVSGVHVVTQYYLPTGPKSGLYHGARGYLRQHPVDAIVATGDPYVLFWYASLLSREFGVPWVADFRDPWSQDQARFREGFAKRWAERVERRTVATAAAVTTVDVSFRDGLVGLHRDKRVEVIPNGYDPEALQAAEDVEQDPDTFTLAFAGTVSPWHPMESVCRVLDDFVRSDPALPFRFHLVGVARGAAWEETLRTGFPALAERTTFTPRLPNPEAARVLARAHALLLFNMYAHTGTKIYDYLALRRHVLLCYTDDPESEALRARHYNVATAPGADDRIVENMVRLARAGTVVKDAPHLRRVLGELGAEFRAKGALDCPSVDVEGYSRRAQAGRLAELLREVAR